MCCQPTLEGKEASYPGELSGGERPGTEHLDKLNAAAEQYCPDTLEVVAAWITDPAAADRATGRLYTKVPIDQLEPGYILLEDLKTPDGHLILSAGLRLSDIQVERLRNFQEVWNLKGTVRASKVD